MLDSIAGLKKRIVEQLARGYIAGPEAADAIRVSRWAAGRGWSSTICPWDGPDDDPETVAANYELALQAIRNEAVDSYLSIKAPALHYSFEALRPLLEAASECGVRVHFDALGPESASPTFKLIERALGSHRNLGCTLPSRWRRSLADAARILDWGIPVRIVKGQWPDPKEPHLDPRAGFLDLIDALRGRAAHVAVATHDTALAKEALSRLLQSRTPCQLEQLFGLPLRDASVAKPLGVGVRIYVAYGQAWLPYCLSQARRRPIILAWAIRDGLLAARRNAFAGS